MTEFIRENKKLCIAIFCIGILVLGVGIVIFRGVAYRGVLQNAPESTLTETPSALSDEFLDYKELNMCVRCAGTDYVLWLPSDAQVEQEYIKASINDMNIVVTVSSRGMEDMLRNYIPQRLYFSVIGYEPTTNIVLMDSGYCKLYPAEYAVSVSEAQISVRTATCAVLTYAFKVSDERYIYLSVSTESKANYNAAKELLDAVASSLRKYENVEPVVQDAMLSDMINTEGNAGGVSATKEESGKQLTNQIGKYDISFKHRIPNATDNGILVMMWENYTVEPLSLTVFGVDGGQVMPIEEECVPGFYAFEVGKTPAGVYVFKGSTDVELLDVYIELYEADDYYRIYGE